MSEKTVTRSTSEIYARRFLDYGPDGSVILWAESMTLSGFASDNLFILLGEIAPFNKFEIDALLDRIQRELSIPKIHSEEEALILIATSTVQKYVQGMTDGTETLFSIAQLCIEHGHADVIFDFYQLHYAAVDLATDEYQYYWPNMHRGNVEKVIRDYCIKWLDDHPLDVWRNYEWRKPQNKD